MKPTGTVEGRLLGETQAINPDWGVIPHHDAVRRTACLASMRD